MTPKLIQICGCEIFIITKDTKINLNIFRTIPVTYLQQRSIWRHTHNSLFSTTSAAHFKYKVFPYSEFLHATIKYSSWCITCLPTKPEYIIHIKCDICFCGEFPEYNSTDEELDDGPNSSIIQI